MTDRELVVLLGDDGTPIGTAAKSEVHGPDTPLHLAFSCHVFNRDGQVLVTRRALTKKAWPGVWTNSFCGHPSPGEAIEDAVRRRAAQELGITLHTLRPALPDFRYRATDAGGIVEHEVCPVFAAVTDDDPVPDLAEIAEARWVDPADLSRALSATPWAFSPWLVMQTDQMRERRTA